ncbi:MAG: hypothetical protein Q9206_004331 [Seirophora lacunosa]
MAALWMARCGIKARVIDKRDASVGPGHADGIQPRTSEIFDSFDILDRIWKESYHMPEMCMWNPGGDGLIHRTSRMPNTVPGISRFPYGVLLAQHRVESILLEKINKSSTVEIHHSVEALGIEIDSNQIQAPNSHAVTVTLRRAVKGHSEHPMTNGSDKPRTEEPQRVAVKQSRGYKETVRANADSGAIMIIPREEGLVRIYCQLTSVSLDSGGRFDRSRITPDTILEAARNIIRPYKLECKYRDWWTVYQVGQRIGNHFSAEERVFLAGDAIHTHSPKAGQGMNVSMQDTYNLGWKLAMVVKGIAKPSILKTYETERRSVAQELIAGDQGLSRAWSSPPQEGAGDQNGAAMTEFGRVFKQLQISAMGFGVHYGPSILTAKDSKDTTGATSGDEGGESPSKVDLASSHQHLATKTALGERFPSFRVVHHCNARSWHLADWLKSDGIFHILLFAGNVSLPTQMDRVRRFACEMTAKTEFIPLRRRFPSIPDGCSNGVPSGNTDGIAQLLTIHSAPREQVEFHDFPSLLRPFDEEMGYDYDSIFVDDESYFEGHGHAYDGYGVDPTKGCVMVVRPDQHVAWIGEIEDVPGLTTYFAGILMDPMTLSVAGSRN